MSVKVRVPYVCIVVPLAANNSGPGSLVRVSILVAGRTLISAPVSTKNCCLELSSHRKKRPLLWPAAEATIGGRPDLFPTKHRVGCIFELPFQMCDGSNTTRLMW